jgi:SpoVK/Ycf46/Vps4 family AAA+-type ATPase
VLTNVSNAVEIAFIQYFLSLEHLKAKLKIIVIEDIDGMSGVIRSMVLNYLDGIMPMHNVVFIATTNYPERLDIAIKNRPSRFDSFYTINLPNKISRGILLQRFFPNIDATELDKCVEASKGFSGAYFKEVYIYSKLNDLSAFETIKYLQNRIKFFNNDESSSKNVLEDDAVEVL